MTLPLWGQLEKSQDDNESVEDAIVRLIAVHEADPDSHLGVGESLEMHKAEDVIDHKIGSVLVDKMSYTEDITELNFESLDGLGINGDVDISDGPRLSLYIETGAVEFSQAYTTLAYGADYLDFTRDMLFQFSAVNIYGMSNFNAFFVFGSYYASGDHEGMGFVWNNTVVKGFVRGDGATNYTADLSIDNTFSHVFRVQWDAILKKAYFYIDGVLKATITIVTISGSSEPELFFRAETNGSTDGNVVVRRVRVSKQQ